MEEQQQQKKNTRSKDRCEGWAIFFSLLLSQWLWMFALIQTFSIYFYIYVYDVQVNNHRMLRKISKILLFVCNITVNVQLLPTRATNMNHCYCYIFVPFSILLELFSLFVGILLHDCINTVEILLRIKWFDDEQNEESTFFFIHMTTSDLLQCSLP